MELYKHDLTNALMEMQCTYTGQGTFQALVSSTDSFFHNPFFVVKFNSCLYILKKSMHITYLWRRQRGRNVQVLVEK